MFAPSAIHTEILGFPPVGVLISSGDTIPPSMPVNDVANRFFDSNELESLALVDNGLVFGLATRSKCFALLFRRFGFELFGKDPIIDIADKHPLIVDEGENLNTTLERAMSRSTQDIYDEVVVVDRTGKFKGLLSIKQLVAAQSQALAQCDAERQQAVERLQEMQKHHDFQLEGIAGITRDVIHHAAGLIDTVKLTGDALESKYQPIHEKYARLTDACASLQEKLTTRLKLSGPDAK